MTFIVGMNCSDGIVLASDTLESGGVAKRYRAKLYAVTASGEWGVAWGVAGNAYVADKFSDKIKTLLGTGQYDRASIELTIENCLKYIRKQHPEPDNDIDVIFGIFGSPTEYDKKKKPYLGVPEARLYRGTSNSACLSPEREYAVIGMDVTLAAFLLDNTYHRFIRVAEAKRLGVFATALMEKYAAGVGGAILSDHPKPVLPHIW